MSTGAYSPDKVLAHPDRLRALRAGKQPYPVHLHLIISDLCNLACPECAYRLPGYSSNQLFNDSNGSSNPNRMLATPLVESILSDCVQMGTKAIEFTGGGEPTVHPDCAKLLASAQAKKLDTALITNGLLLVRRTDLLDLATRCRWVRVSVDAAKRATYDMVRPGLNRGRGAVNDNFARALLAIDALRKARDAAKTNCTIGAGFVVQRHNWREIYDAAKLYRDAGADNIRISGAFTPEGDAYHASYRKEAVELEKLAVNDLSSSTFKVYGRFAEKLDDLHRPPDYQTCWYQHLTTYIGGDGNLYRCCVTAYNKRGLIGSVAEQGFKALWDSAKKTSTFAGFDASSCRFCQFNDRNRLIQAAVEAEEGPRVEGLTHPNFV